MVREHLPEIADALYFGHAGNQGDAVRWGAQLGAAVADMSAYQGHGSVATPHGILITWALMTEGGIQVNERGERFSNEHLGYSEALPAGAAPARRRRLVRLRRAAAPARHDLPRLPGSPPRRRCARWTLRFRCWKKPWRKSAGMRPEGRILSAGISPTNRLSSALLRHQGDRRALPHPGRTGRRRARARARSRRASRCRTSSPAAAPRAACRARRSGATSPATACSRP